MRAQHASNEKGSASVIVIMVMLLLVVFGILAFVSGGSSLRLAEKNAQTVKAYYLLDKHGEIAVARIADMLKSENVGPGMVDKAAKMEGVADAVLVPQKSGNPVLALKIQDTTIKSGASLRIRVTPKVGENGTLGLAIQEWKLIYKPFEYEGIVNLWEGVN